MPRPPISRTGIARRLNDIDKAFLSFLQFLLCSLDWDAA